MNKNFDNLAVVDLLHFIVFAQHIIVFPFVFFLFFCITFMLITRPIEAASCDDPRIFWLLVWFGFLVVSYNVFFEIKYELTMCPNYSNNSSVYKMQ